MSGDGFGLLAALAVVGIAAILGGILAAIGVGVWLVIS